MSKFDSPLNDLKVASPCSADWNEMFGDERKRFCGDCKLNVYNLSGLSRGEAEALIMNAEGSVCVRFYKRADGSIITKDCPVGWARVKQRARTFTTAAFSLVLALISGVFITSLFTKRQTAVGTIFFRVAPPELQHTMGAISIRPTEPEHTMGKVRAAESPTFRD